MLPTLHIVVVAKTTAVGWVKRSATQLRAARGMLGRSAKGALTQPTAQQPATRHTLSTVMAASCARTRGVMAATQACPQLARGGGTRARVGSVVAASLRKSEACLGGRLRGYDENGRRVRWYAVLALMFLSALSPDLAVAQGREACVLCRANYSIGSCKTAAIDKPPIGATGIGGKVLAVRNACQPGAYSVLDASRSTNRRVSGPIRLYFSPCDEPTFSTGHSVVVVVRKYHGRYEINRNCSGNA